MSIKKKYRFLYKKPADVTSTDYQHKKNIRFAAADVIQAFESNLEVLLIAEMQSGKTEVMRRIVYLIKQYNSDLRNLNIDIDRSNIYVLLSTSSTALKTQLKVKIPNLQHHIFHLPDVNHWLKNPHSSESILMEMSESSLVIIDESHCDAEIGHTIDNFRSTLNHMSKKNNSTFLYTVRFSDSIRTNNCELSQSRHETRRKLLWVTSNVFF